MRLALNRRIALDAAPSVATVITEVHREWTKGWVARLVDGNRRFIRQAEQDLSTRGNGCYTYLRLSTTFHRETSNSRAGAITCSV